MPSGAQTWISCGYDNAWTVGEHLTAHVFDALNMANWQRQGDNRAKKPPRIRRPSDGPPADARAERNEMRARAFLERQKRVQAQMETIEET